jgi:hypothetical protein
MRWPAARRHKGPPSARFPETVARAAAALGHRRSIVPRSRMQVELQPLRRTIQSCRGGVKIVIVRPSAISSTKPSVAQSLDVTV